jgi:hypothetical protein
MIDISIAIIIFAVGITVGSFVTSRIVARRARRLLHLRGDALREITNHKWDTGDHNDAVVITRIALKGLEHKHKRIGNE